MNADKHRNSFPIQALEKITCFCGGVLHCDIETDRAMQAQVYCITCTRTFEIVDGIMLMSVAVSDEIVQKESMARDTQAGQYDKRLEKRITVEIEPAMEQLGDVREKDIIEYGCGTGRFTIRMADKARLIVASDISLESLRMVQQKAQTKHLTNLALIHTDSTQLRLQQNSFDVAVSFQVLEHIPHKWQRALWCRNMYTGLRVGGEMFHTVYYYNARRRWQGVPQRGFHANEIYFQYYTRRLLASEFAAYFGPLQFKYLDSMVPGLQRFVPVSLRTRLGAIFTNIPGLREFSHLIVVRGAVSGPKQVSLHQGVIWQQPSIFKKYVHWFTDPYQLRDADHMTLFSYTDVAKVKYKKKSGVTRVIALDQPLSSIWEAMRKSFIQKQIKRGERKGIQVCVTIEYDDFFALYQSFRQEKKLPIEPRSVLEQNGFLITARFEKNLLAAGLFVADGVHMRAWILVSDRFQEDGVLRELVGYANRMVIWQAITYAYHQGFKTFDLGGLNIPPRNTTETSLNEFKQAFGGEDVPGYFYSGSASVRHTMFTKAKKMLSL